MPKPYHIFKPDPEGGPKLVVSSKTLGHGFEDLNYIAQEGKMSPGDLLYFPDLDYFWMLTEERNENRVFDLRTREGHMVEVPWKELNVCFETDDIVFGHNWGPILANQLRSMTR